MARLTIDEAALARIQRKLKKISEFNTRASAPMQEALELLEEEVTNYPAKNPNAFSQLATPAQKRAYWAKVRSGEIKHREGVGYVRTGKLKSSWRQKIIRSAGKQIAGASGIRGVLYSDNVRYAQWVQGSKYQQPFHGKSRWVTEKLALRRHSGKIKKIFAAWIKRQLTR